VHWDIDSATLIIAFYALLVTAVAAGAGVWAALEQRANNKLEKRNGDLQSQLVRIEEQRDERSGPERRAAVATALLFELDSLEPNLRRMWGSKDAWGHSFTPRDVALEIFIEHVDLFRPETVHAVLHLRGLVHDLRNYMPAGVVLDRTLDTPHRTWFMRSLAGFTVLAIHEARTQLLSEGGVTVPFRRDYRDLHEPQLPELPPQPEHLAQSAQLTLNAARADLEAGSELRLLRAAEASEDSNRG
jgi:hypothetical protein